jgi:hypothetical protein
MKTMNVDEQWNDGKGARESGVCGPETFGDLEPRNCNRSYLLYCHSIGIIMDYGWIA